MPALQAPKKISRRQELRQDAVVTATAKAVDVYEEHRALVIGVAVAIVIAVLAFIGYTFYLNAQDDRAAAQLGGIVNLYEQARWDEALNGTPEQMGLLEIADRYGNTTDGNLARYYAADALYRLNRKDEALRYFQAYDKEPNYLGASAFAAEAAIQEDIGSQARAAELYLRAATIYENALTSPEYLLEAARNYEAVGDYDAARDMYELIERDYPDADAAGGLEFYFARLDALQGKF
jgi:tetratricopeptide (TPR) repeat protein